MEKARLDKKLNVYVHVGCGGHIMYDGTWKKKTLYGFGGARLSSGETKLQVDYIITKGISGGCLKCRAEGKFQLGNPTTKTSLRNLRKK